MKKYAVYTLILLLTFLGGRYSKPTKVEIREVEKIVVRTTETQKETGVVHEKETRKRDGTIVIERRTDYRKESNTDTRMSKTSIKETKTSYLPQFQVTTLYRLDTVEPRPKYTLGLSYRLFGSVYLTGQTDERLDYKGIGLTIGF